MNLKDTALQYLGTGLCVLPASKAQKRPLVPWKDYQTRKPNGIDIVAWYNVTPPPDAVCLVAGAISGNLELIDFDGQGALFDDWAAAIPEELLKRLCIERSQSGGMHVIYRCSGPVHGNTKLARGKMADGDAAQTLIETRGEGGIFLCQPTAGYDPIQGDIYHLPVITPEERQGLLMAAWQLDEQPEAQAPAPAPVKGMPMSGEIRPGDDYNTRGDIAGLLKAHGWKHLRLEGDNDHWQRPGKDGHGTSATIRNMGGVPVFYCFSSNAAPFQAMKAYSLFTVYAMLDHNGDHAAAASQLRREGYGSTPEASRPTDVDLSGLSLQVAVPAAPAASPAIVMPQDPALPREDMVPDPGPIPESLLNVPGFISQIMDVTLSTAPYPNPVLAFAGALVLQGHLAGRKVRDSMDNRTNVYVLALADSGTGKEQPRRVNAQVLDAIDGIKALGDTVASAEGLADVMRAQPSMLFQVDEMDTLITAIRTAKDPRYEAIAAALMKFYTSASSVFPMRVRAGQESTEVINQPCLCLMGSAVPKFFYESLTFKMLENGFFSRLLIMEAGKRGPGQTPRIIKLPQPVLDTARWWHEQPCGQGNLTSTNPEPRVLEYNGAAMNLLTCYRRHCEACYDASQLLNNQAGMAIWTRSIEKASRLALLHQISRAPDSEEIDEYAVDWAARFVEHQTRRMLFMAQGHVSDNPFHAACLKVIERLRAAGGRIDHKTLCRRTKVDTRTFKSYIDALSESGQIQVEMGRGQANTYYRVL